MVNTMQQSVQGPQRLPSMTAGVISIHSPWERAAPVAARGAIKPSDYVDVAGCAAPAASLSVLQPA